MTISIRTLRIATVGGVVVLALSAVPSGLVLAECVPLSRWPSFREAVPSARRIIVGSVVPLGPKYGLDDAGHRIPMTEFRISVDEVLRGEAPTEIEIHRLKSGAPTPRCPDETVLYVYRGDRIALAYGASLAGSSHGITAVAFVSPSRPTSLMQGAERLSLAEIRRLAATLPPTDTEDGQPTSPVGWRTSEPTANGVAAVVASLFGMATLLWLRRRLVRA